MTGAKEAAKAAAKAGAASEAGAGATQTCPGKEPKLDLDHVMEGTVRTRKRKKKAKRRPVGLHSSQGEDAEKREKPPAPGEKPPPSRIVVPREDAAIGDKGCYGADAWIYDEESGAWVNEKFSSMFPDEWSAEKIAAEIQEAFRAAQESGDLVDSGSGRKRFSATNPSGVRIEGYYNAETGAIETGYPVAPAP